MKKFLFATSALVFLAATSASAADCADRLTSPHPRLRPCTVGLASIGASTSGIAGDMQRTRRPYSVSERSPNAEGRRGDRGLPVRLNYQFGQWVWGFETDFQASGQKGGTTLQIDRFTTVTTDHKLPWFGTSRSRLGVLWVTRRAALRNGRCCLRSGQG